MIRKLLLPLVAVALLGGCVSYGYNNRHGSGDYYYGAPSVDYYYSSPYYYGGPYSYSPYPYYGGYYSYYGGSYGYGYPYGGYYGYYGGAYPYYGGGGYSHYYTPRRPSTDPTPDRPRPQWRDLNQLRRSSTVNPAPSTRYTRKPMPQLRRAPIEAMAPSSQTRIEMPSQPRYAPAPRLEMPSQPRYAPAPRIEMPSQPRSAPAPRSDSSSLGGMVRRVRKSDPSDETTP